MSVTQSFNTTTSMGRLTLNMLLSFAQFEREVTAERIRDKLAASKQRGMWMGGTPPLGYQPDGRSLTIVEERAELVRLIFSLYLDLGNVRLLQDDLNHRNIVKPVRTTKAGRSFGGTSFSRGELYAILSNPIYIGRIRHRDTTFDGLHEAIIDQSIWDQVQARLTDNRSGQHHIRAAAHPSILAGKLFDATGEKMIASHASKGARRYRYYVSSNLQHRGDAAHTDGMRIPAPEIETLVCTKLAELFDDPIMLVERTTTPSAAPDVLTKAIAETRTVAETLRGSNPTTIIPLIDQIVQKINVAAGAVTITLDGNQIADHLGIAASSDSGDAGASSAFQITAPARLKRSGLAMRLILPGGNSASSRVDEKLISAIATAHHWWEQLLQDPNLRVSDLAAIHSVSKSWITRTLRLAFLDPAIVDEILNGTAPAHFTLETLRTPESVSMLWSAQRAYHRIPIAR